MSGRGLGLIFFGCMGLWCSAVPNEAAVIKELQSLSTPELYSEQARLAVLISQAPREDRMTIIKRENRVIDLLTTREGPARVVNRITTPTFFPAVADYSQDQTSRLRGPSGSSPPFDDVSLDSGDDRPESRPLIPKPTIRQICCYSLFSCFCPKV